MKITVRFRPSTCCFYLYALGAMDSNAFSFHLSFTIKNTFLLDETWLKTPTLRRQASPTDTILEKPRTQNFEPLAVLQNSMIPNRLMSEWKSGRWL
ncbi:hypothetical protein CDAR_453351 [Caerostris darwini]|uniref:Uncharacterized protein n=1 Tax=Caerostris darwini TaxID=1538125 RepID=A0AAV4TFX8_9ARAC|nr:hypothetical protein CDAR_453351 [Caerostris darwini]